MLHVRTALLTSAIAAFGFVSFSGAQAQTAPGPCPSAAVTDHGQPVNGRPLASPPASAEVKLGGKSVVLHYNAPSVRCRTIMGGVVPYKQVWRTGANAATTLITAAHLRIGTVDVPPGTYTIFSMPAAAGTPWQLIINRQTGQWGTEYHQEKDLGRTQMMSKPVTSPQEAMSLSFENVQGKTADLHLRWANTDEYVKVQAE
jgi:hypothetical protein